MDLKEHVSFYIIRIYFFSEPKCGRLFVQFLETGIKKQSAFGFFRACRRKEERNKKGFFLNFGYFISANISDFAGNLIFHQK